MGGENSKLIQQEIQIYQQLTFLPKECRELLHNKQKY